MNTVTDRLLGGQSRMPNREKPTFAPFASEVRSVIASLQSHVDACTDIDRRVQQVLALLWAAADILAAIDRPGCEQTAEAR